MMTALLCLLLCASPAPLVSGNLDDLLDAIHQVESDGATDVAVYWDVSGYARGPYSFHRAAWVDATRFLKVDWPWTDAHDLCKARWAAAAYMVGYAEHYGRTSLEDCARIFNGGPHGWRKRSTDEYWSRVRRGMEARMRRSE